MEFVGPNSPLSKQVFSISDAYTPKILGLLR